METKKTKVLVLFYSTYGHVYALAKAIAEGVKSTGAEVTLKRVPETLSVEILDKMHALEAQKAFADVPIAKAEELADYDAIIIGTPTRFGLMAAQMKAFVDSLGQLWMTDALVGKVASFFTSTAGQHGGVEATLLTSMIPFFHLGCIMVGLPYSHKPLTEMNEIIGFTPYGAGTIAGGMGQRQPSALELEACKFQGKHVAEIAAKLAKK